ncbi:MAG: class I SAM-dependent methyltransferase [Acidothermaceae bacterium]
MTAAEIQTSEAAAIVIRGPWDDVSPAPRAIVRAAIGRAIFSRAAARLGVRLELPGGHIAGDVAADSPTMRIHRPDDFFRRIGVDGLIGFGEGYMVGDWDADDLAAALVPFARQMASLVPKPLQRARRWYDARQPASDENDLAGSRSNVARHYDLSNELFALFLDETMTYSSAVWADADSLADAQKRKIDRLLDAANVGAGTRLLEIGTGWGALAVRAAQRGATVTTLTLSEEQQHLARQRALCAGVADRVDVQLRDYREAVGRYDAILSVEMLEAVGSKYWADFFAAVDRLLRRGGRVGLQVITIDHERLLATRGTYTWIHKYVFPGGIIPSLRAIDDVLAAHTGLRVTARAEHGTDYARTLHTWLERFRERSREVLALGFDQQFIRMWRFYLAYCEAGFATGYLNVHQLLLERPGQ